MHISANNTAAGILFMVLGSILCASCSGSGKVTAPPSSYFLEDYACFIGNQTWVISGAAITPEFFQSVEVSPVLGRGFQPENYSPGHKNVVLISHRLWQDKIVGDARVIDKTIEINGSQYTVIGIMPAEFGFPPGVDLWIPR